MAFRILRPAFLIVFTCFLVHEYSAAQWEWRNPLPQGNSLADIQAFSASVCYTAGERGTFLSTTSGGNTWSLINIPGKPDITYLQFFDQSTGILLGKRDSVSLLLRTTDAGEQWADLKPSPGMVTAAYFLNADSGWAATTSALLFTGDAGNNWNERALPSTTLRAIFFLDSSMGWSLSSDTVYRTTDGGNSWLGAKMDSLFGWLVSLNKIVFVNPRVGWLIATSRGPNHFDGHIFKSTDGGAHWFEQLTVGEDLAIYRTFSDLDMRNELLGWAVSSGSVYRTEDGGKNWKEVGQAQYLDQLSPASDTELWACGSYGVLDWSSDAGATWTPVHRGGIASLNDLYWLDQKRGFAAGDTLLLKTRDGGTTWEPIPIQLPGQGFFNAHSVWFVDSLRGWIGVERSGGWGSLLLTTDGGHSWQAQLDSVNRIFRLFFFGENLGWASSGNKVYRTTDRGATWHAGGSATDPGEFESLFFTTPDSGWAGGYLGVAQSTDSGISWATVIPDGTAGVYVKDIAFTTPQVGWLVGYSGNDGYIFKTEDGGRSWHTQPHLTEPMNTWFLGVSFADQNRGWAVGQSYAGGFAYQTTDGGTQWVRDDIPLNRSILRVKIQGEEVWVLGDEGAILHRSLNGTAVGEKTAERQSVVAFELGQNFPNPFNPFTIIKYTVGGASYTTLVVYDVLGREVAVLVNEPQAPGSYAVKFSAQGGDGRGLASGVYIYRLTAGSFAQSRKMVVLK